MAAAEAPPRATSKGATEHWNAKTITVTLDPSLGDMEGAVKNAFATWRTQDTSLPKITFAKATKSGEAERDGVSRVLATKKVAPGHEKDVAYTVSYADSASGEILESDIVFNLARNFADTSASCSSTWDTEAVATHEVGHFFGLSEDMGDANATMFYETRPCDLGKRTLTDADLASIDVVYPIPSRSKGIVASCSSSGSSPSGGLPIALALFFVGTRCYVRRHAELRHRLEGAAKRSR